MAKIAAELTPRQIQILRWLDDNPTNGAQWLVDGKPIRRQPSSKWNMWEISGPNGSIRMSLADNKALRGYLGTGGYRSGKLFEPNEMGKAAIAKAAANRTPNTDDRTDASREGAPT